MTKLAKRIFTVLLAGLLTASMAACGNGGDSSSTAEGSSTTSAAGGESSTAASSDTGSAGNGEVSHVVVWGTGNAVYLRGRKVCGILTEAAVDFESSGLHYAILGKIGRAHV